MQQVFIEGGLIRKLWRVETHAYRDHLLRLDAESRRNRFCGGIADDTIRSYAARQDSNLQPSGYEASHCSPCTLAKTPIKTAARDHRAQIGSAAGRSPEAAETAGSMVPVIFSARRLTPCHAVHRAVVADFLVTQIARRGVAMRSPYAFSA